MECWAYDLDGVLADVDPRLPPALQRRYGLLKGPDRAARAECYLLAYNAAPVLLDPPQRSFHVITARRDDPAIRATTEQWLHQYFRGRVLSLSMLTQARRVDVVVPYKAAAIERAGATDFAEDNIDVVRGVAAALPGVRVWLYQQGRLDAGPPYKKDRKRKPVGT